MASVRNDGSRREGGGRREEGGGRREERGERRERREERGGALGWKLEQLRREKCKRGEGSRHGEGKYGDCVSEKMTSKKAMREM